MFWIGLGFVELVVVMPWTAGRYFLCILPAMCWAFTAMLEKIHWQKYERRILMGTAVVALLVAHADYLQANTIQALAQWASQKQLELEKLAPKNKSGWYYLSDTFDGSQPYMQPLGWASALPDQSYKKGDLLLRAYYRKSSWWNIDDKLPNFKLIYQVDMRSRNPIRVMDVPASAGFYASCWGALPWTITPHPLERYQPFQAIIE